MSTTAGADSSRGTTRSGFDPELVVRAAVQQMPGLDWNVATELAEAARRVAGLDDVDAPELARRLLADAPRLDASAANAVAVAAVDQLSRPPD